MAEFESLCKAMTKSSKVFEANGGIPRFLVRILVDLEDFVSKCLADKASFKKLKPVAGRALNRMKLTLKKFNEPYKNIMDEYRKNPVVSESSDSEEEEEESDDSESEEENESDSDSDSSSSSSSSSESDKEKKKKKEEDDNDSDSDSVRS